MEKYLKFDEALRSAKSILICSHVNPDGDTLGTMCALQLAIQKQYKKKADMLILSKLPKIYEFLPNINKAKSIEMLNKSREYDIAIAVDIASLDRLINAQILFDKAKYKINIDHHTTNNLYGDLAIVEPKTSSSGEVLFKIFKKLGWEINLDIATCIYTAILTDTGGFRFENTNSSVLRVAAELVDLGVNPKELFKKCYETKTKNMVLFQNYCVGKANFVKNEKIAYTVIYKKDMEKFNAGEDYTDGIAETLRSITTTDVSFVVKEVDSKTCKISMRSKSVDIAKVCSVFGGGGHKFAAGCTMKYSCEDSVKKLLAEIEKEF